MLIALLILGIFLAIGFFSVASPIVLATRLLSYCSERGASTRGSYELHCPDCGSTLHQALPVFLHVLLSLEAFLTPLLLLKLTFSFVLLQLSDQSAHALLGSPAGILLLCLQLPRVVAWQLQRRARSEPQRYCGCLPYQRPRVSRLRL